MWTSDRSEELFQDIECHEQQNNEFFYLLKVDAV